MTTAVNDNYQLKQLIKEQSEKKIRPLLSFKLLTSTILVQRSYQLSYQVNWELVICEFLFIS